MKPRWEIKLGNVMEEIDGLEDNSIDCIITSPPYWGLREYAYIKAFDEEAEADGFLEQKKVEYGRLFKEKNVYPEYSKNYDEKKLKWLIKITFLNVWDSEKDGCEHIWENNVCDNCDGWLGQLGLEPTFEMFINHLFQIFDTLKQKLTKWGTLWVNLGDTYAGGGGLGVPQSMNAVDMINKWDINKNSIEWNTKKVTSYPDFVPQAKYRKNMAKSLFLIPYRFAIKMVDHGRWRCRNVIIWHKPSVMPSSAKDRFTNDFEPVFLFSKQKKYYFKQQLEESVEEDIIEGEKEIQNKDGSLRVVMKDGKPMRNKRTVWSINTAQFKDAHFAVFPEELVECPVDAGCPRWVCKKCGKPQETEYVTEEIKNRPNTRHDARLMDDNTPAGIKKVERPPPDWEPRERIETIISCDCNAGFRHGVVLDPFSGAATTGVVTLKQGKKYIGIEINPEYRDMSARRLDMNNYIPLDEFFI